MRIRELQERDRPRERLLSSGVAALSDAELLAVLLGSGTARESALELSCRLLNDIGLGRLSVSSPEELCGIHGVGRAKACRLLAALELHRRLQSEQAPRRITDAASAAAYCLPLIGHLEQEHFLVVLLDVRLQVKSHHIVTRGLVDSTIIHPREVFREAVRHNAHAVLLAHNHPSGDPRPSAEDLEVASSMERTGHVVGIRVIDQLILTKTSWASIAPSG